jgi:hypothetical protein
MSNRAEVLKMIGAVMNRIKNSASRDERFDLLENVQILSGILTEVTNFECNLLADLDVD